MVLTWKKWGVFFAGALALAAACQVYAQMHLSRSIATQGGLGRGREWYARAGKEVLRWARIPWPTSHQLSQRLARRFDADAPQTRDPETVMGLALLGPPPNEEDRSTSTSWITGHWNWYRRLSEVATSLATDTDTKVNLERLALFVETTNSPEATDQRKRELEKMASPHSTTTQAAGEAAGADGRERDLIVEPRIQERVNQMDPLNAVYAWRLALDLTSEIVSDTQPRREDYVPGVPSKEEAQHNVLTAPERLVPTARRIDEVLTPVNERGKLDHYRGYHWLLTDKALAYRWGEGSANRYVLAITEDIGFSMNPHFSRYRQLTRRLCFLADCLAARGEDALALRLYWHTYRLGEKLMLDEGNETTLVEIMNGYLCADAAARHLMEFWARKQSPENVMRLNDFAFRIRHIVGDVRQGMERLKMSGYVHDRKALHQHLRTAGFTWWCGATAQVGLVGLLAALTYLVLRRGRHLGPTPLCISGRSVCVLIGVPVALMVVLGLLLPIDVGTPQAGGAVLLWACVLSLAWIIAIGLVARRVAAAGEAVRVPRTGWVWPATALAGVGAALVAFCLAAHPAPAAAVVLAAALAAGVVVWFVLVLVAWIRRRTPQDRSYRARTAKVFAVLAMLASAVSLATALASMPLTHHFEKAFLKAFAQQYRDEPATYLGTEWPEQFTPLSLEVFRIDTGAADRTEE